jgi:hypothetical protein
VAASAVATRSRQIRPESNLQSYAAAPVVPAAMRLSPPRVTSGYPHQSARPGVRPEPLLAPGPAAHRVIQSRAMSGAMSSYRGDGIVRTLGAVACLPQKAVSRVRAIAASTSPLFGVLATAVGLRVPSFEVKEYV